MSNRNVRKLCGGNVLPPPDDDDSDNEFQPKFVQSSAQSTYAGLEVSDNSDSSDPHSDPEHQKQEEPEEEQQEKEIEGQQEEEQEEIEELQDEIEEQLDLEAKEPVGDTATPSTSTGARKKKRNKRKKKSKKAKQYEEAVKKAGEMDEIDRSILAVNALLGEPVAEPESEKPREKISDFMAVQSKYLNAINEFKRLFGPDEDDRRYQPGHGAKLHRSIIVPFNEEYYKQYKNGLSMSILEKKDNITYFVYNHDAYYQKMQRMFLFAVHNKLTSVLLPVDVASREMHIEFMLECADNYFRVQEFIDATDMIHIIIPFLQCCSHPSFDLTDPNVRLEYKYVENRVFHVTILKYIYMLTNKACHRTSLELAKVMLRIDPSDPCGVLLIIDVLALRAREHEWFITAFETWKVEREAGTLFNMQYSYPLALFHLNRECKDLMKQAIMCYPTVAFKILHHCGALTTRLKEHPIFTTYGMKTTSEELQELIDFYAKFVYEKWREPEILKWFLSVLDELLDDFENQPHIQVRCMIFSNERMNIYRGYPLQVIRHLAITVPLWKFVIDENPKPMIRGFASNPIPPVESIDRYKYEVPSRRPERRHPPRSLWYNFFSSLNPNHPMYKGRTETTWTSLFDADPPQHKSIGRQYVSKQNIENDYYDSLLRVIKSTQENKLKIYSRLLMSVFNKFVSQSERVGHVLNESPFVIANPKNPQYLRRTVLVQHGSDLSIASIKGPEIGSVEVSERGFVVQGSVSISKIHVTVYDSLPRFIPYTTLPREYTDAMARKLAEYQAIYEDIKTAAIRPSEITPGSSSEILPESSEFVPGTSTDDEPGASSEVVPEPYSEVISTDSIENEPEFDNDVSSENELGSKTEPGSGNKPESENDPGSAIETESETEPQSVNEPQSENVHPTIKEPGSEFEDGFENELGSQNEPDSENNSQSDNENESKNKVDPIPENGENSDEEIDFTVEKPVISREKKILIVDEIKRRIQIEGFNPSRFDLIHNPNYAADFDPRRHNLIFGIDEETEEADPGRDRIDRIHNLLLMGDLDDSEASDDEMDDDDDDDDDSEDEYSDDEAQLAAAINEQMAQQNDENTEENNQTLEEEVNADEDEIERYIGTGQEPDQEQQETEDPDENDANE